MIGIIGIKGILLSVIVVVVRIKMITDMGITNHNKHYNNRLTNDTHNKHTTHIIKHKINSSRHNNDKQKNIICKYN